MKVIVCGAGQVGYNIARRLAGEHNDVTVIDQSQLLVQRVNDTLDVQGMLGFASHPDVLERAGAEDADMIIAVTYADEVNMVACQVAHSLFNVPTKVARVRDQSYLEPAWRDLFSRDHMPIDVIISPELEVAKAVRRRLDVPGTFDMVPFADDLVRLIGVRCDDDCPVINTPLRQLTELFPDLNIVVVGIAREGRLIVPSGDDQMLAGDEVYFVSDRGHVKRALTLFGHEEREAQRVVIVGGGHIGLSLAHGLEQEAADVRVKIVELDAERAEQRRIARIVDQGDRALAAVPLGEQRDQNVDLVVVGDGDHGLGVLHVGLGQDFGVERIAVDHHGVLELLAKRHGCQRAVTLINNPGYAPLLSSLGIDAAVDPRATTVSTILQHVRRGRIRGVHSLRDGAAEIIEAEALETSSLVGVPLRDNRLPAGIIVGAVVRAGRVIIPRGDTVIQVHDRVVIFALADMVRKVEKMFAVRIDFF